VRIGTLGTESEAEIKLKVIQESCLERAFHISMDRVDYRASDASQVEQEEEEVLQELKELENPEASCYPISLRVVPLDLCQRSIGLRQQPGFKTNRQGAVGQSKAMEASEASLLFCSPGKPQRGGKPRCQAEL